MTTLRHLAFGLFAIACLSGNVRGQEQLTPVGNWQTLDDTTGELKSLVAISQTHGILSGRVVKILGKSTAPEVLCTKCTDDRKDKPVLGMEIIRGAKRLEGDNVWEGGTILDPENGNEYSLRLTPVDGGKKLEVRGYYGIFFRTQTWIRVP